MHRGWHFLQIPGPSNTPQAVLQAMGKPTIDHRGPEFAALTKGIRSQVRQIFQTKGEVVIYPSSGTGAWEAALTNLFQPGDKVLGYETGHFAVLWKNLATKLGLEVIWIDSDWRKGIEAEKVRSYLEADSAYQIKGVMAVHNETSTGVTSDIKSVREVIDSLSHPTLLLCDVVSSLGTTPFYQDDWGVDVAIAASQKGFMLPPGLGFNSINQKALEISRQNQSPNPYWKWERIVEMNETGYYPYTPASNLLFGLEKALEMLLEEGLENVFHRHRRHAEATRTAAQTWDLENQAVNPAEYSDSTTALQVDEGKADNFRKLVLDEFNMSLGTGLGRLKNQVFRIGHLGDFNDLMLCGTLAGVEMGLKRSGIKHHPGGVQAAMDYLSENKVNH